MSREVIPLIRPVLGDEEAAAAAQAIASGWVAQGPRVAAFEQAVAAHVGAAEGVAVSSCTAALHLALVVAGVGPGDDVMVPSLSFIATANAVRYVGANPVFADVDRATQNLTPATIEAAWTAATRAIVLVHQCGVPAAIEPIRSIAAAAGVPVVEDAACAIGATYGGAPIGAGAALAAFSFHPRKLLTTGEGGMLVTTRADWAARAKRLREHGMDRSASERHRAGGIDVEHYLETGFNYRMTDVQAAIGLVQLGRLDDIVSRRRALAARYHSLLADVDDLGVIADPEGATTNFQSFWVLLPPSWPDRDMLMAQLWEAGITTRRGIMAAHLEPAYAGHPHGPLPVTEELTQRSLILPLHHEMTAADQERVVDALTHPGRPGRVAAGASTGGMH